MRETRAGDIGEDTEETPFKRRILEPMPRTAPVTEPAPGQEPAPEAVPEQEPVAVPA